MPRCEGLPTGPCPKKVNNRTVKNSICDLLLCPSCEASRFPPATRPATEAVKSTQVTVNKLCIDTPTSKTPTTYTAHKSVNTYQGCSASNCSAASKPTNLKSTDADVTVLKSMMSATCDDGLDASCPVCLDAVDDRSLTCDICHAAFHGSCTGLSEEVCKVFITIIGSTGWVCRNCRTVMGGRVVNLQTAMTRTNEEMADMRAIMAELKRDIDSIKGHQVTLSDTADSGWPSLAAASSSSSSSSSSTSTVTPAASLTPQQFVSLEVHKTVKDISRRKCNVVITGLRESSATDSSRAADHKAFLQLCEEHLSIKPNVAPQGCRRLGRSTDQQGRPRRLLVHLRTESCAADLLSSAKQLRLSDDPYIARNVYINADLSPVDAKLAYEERQRQRERRNRRTNTDNNSSHSNSNNETVITNLGSSDIRSHDNHRDTTDVDNIDNSSFRANT